jgi:hypothetical protein
MRAASSEAACGRRLLPAICRRSRPAASRQVNVIATPQAPVIELILAHLGLQARAPPHEQTLLHAA